MAEDDGDEDSEATVKPAATVKKTVDVPTRSITCPASRKPSGAATVLRAMIAVIAFGRISGVMRDVSTPMTRAR